MMDTETILILSGYAALGTLLAGGTLLARRRHGSGFAALVLALNLEIICGFSIVLPLYGVRYPSNPSTLIFVCGAAALSAAVNAALLAAPAATADRLIGLVRRSRLVQRLGLVLLGAIVPLGGLETIAQLTTRLGLVSYFVPVEIRLAQKTEDWRLAHIMSDDFREPDPLLLWRSIPRYPYSSQRFKGPEVAVPKPGGTFRLICYGDSNTDGPSFGSAWAAQLQDLLAQKGTASRRYEVMNAGVGGYSSYQGLMRFREEVDQFQPDVIFISFGWNDASGAIGRPDREYAQAGLLPAVNPFALFIRRLMLRYRSTLVVQHLLSSGAALDVDRPLLPRVDLSAYASNLRGFFATARAHHVMPIVLTRPYRETTEALRRDATWRRNVPSYNEVALQVAAEEGVLAIDVQRAFEGRPELFADECHFTHEGHREMARLLEASLQAKGYVPP